MFMNSNLTSYIKGFHFAQTTRLNKKWTDTDRYFIIHFKYQATQYKMEETPAKNNITSYIMGSHYNHTTRLKEKWRDVDRYFTLLVKYHGINFALFGRTFEA